MRTNITTIIKHLLLLTTLCLLHSCSEKYDGQARRVHLLDGEWLEEYPVTYVYVGSSNLINVQVDLKGKWERSQALFLALHYEEGDYWPSHLSEDEKYAFNMTLNRVSHLKDYFISNNYDKDMNNHLLLTTLYSKGEPKVYADKPLFDKEPGQDLSSFFRVAQSGTSFRVVGSDYVIADTAQPQQFPISEYFSEGIVLPQEFFLQSTELPEELAIDDDINLRFVFPVTAEHYLSWLFELYNNPDAEESFSDMTITLTANLKDLKHYNNTVF